jgi:hypothetical protein
MMKKKIMKISEYPLMSRTLKTSGERFCNLVMPAFKSLVTKKIKTILKKG